MVFSRQAGLTSGADTALRRRIEDKCCEESKGEVGQLQMAAVNVADKVNELGEF
jgi:hypothetical protein